MYKKLLLACIISILSLNATAQCNAAFTATYNQAVGYFQATNTAPHLNHYWLFGDGSSGYGSTVSHTYSIAGVYRVTHRVTDSVTQCTDTTEQWTGLDMTVSCQSNFSVVRDSSNYNLYYFYALPQVTGDVVMSYQWTIDGLPLPLPGSASSFNQVLTPGLHIIGLSITTTTGCTSSHWHTILVSTQPSCMLSASFTTAASTTNPKQISFFPNPSSGSLGYSWNFGDGNSSSQTNPVHTYIQAGTYNVRLAITNATVGCTDTIVRNIIVQGSPADSCTVSFTHTTTDPTHPNRISFTAISNQTITSQTWWIDNLNNPNDSVFVSANNPTYTFTDTGYYMVCLYITTNTGCSGYYCDSVYINTIGGRISNTIPSFPNPASNSVSIRLNLAAENRISVTVYNQSGYAVYRTEKQGNRGTNEITIPVQQLNSGQYFIDIKYGDQQKRSIFQKL